VAVWNCVIGTWAMLPHLSSVKSKISPVGPPMTPSPLPIRVI